MKFGGASVLIGGYFRPGKSRTPFGLFGYQFSALFGALPFSVQALWALEDVWCNEFFVFALKLKIADERGRGDRCYRDESRLGSAEAVVYLWRVSHRDDVVKRL